MLPQSFDELYRRLLRAAWRHHSASRRPEDVASLAETHWELHTARRAISEERRRLERDGVLFTTDDRQWLDTVHICP